MEEKRLGRKPLMIQIAIILLVIVAWEVLPGLLDIDRLVLPPFSEAVGTLNDPLTGDGTLTSNTWVTIKEVAGAFAIASAAGLTVGVCVGLVPWLRRLAMPLLTAGFAIPIMVLIPLFLVSLGLGSASKVAFGALYAFFPVVFGTVLGVGAVEETHRSLGRAFGLSRFAMLRKIVLRSAARPILNGLQTAASIAIIAVISIEMFGSVAGLGYLIHSAGQRLRIAEVYGLILVTLIVAMVLLSVIKLLARALNVRLEMTAE
jgi:ABC-type nitrate/sulfonate/bicarbonate transport system permease component